MILSANLVRFFCVYHLRNAIKEATIICLFLVLKVMGSNFGIHTKEEKSSIKQKVEADGGDEINKCRTQHDINKIENELLLEK